MTSSSRDDKLSVNRFPPGGVPSHSVCHHIMKGHTKMLELTVTILAIAVLVLALQRR